MLKTKVKRVKSKNNGTLITELRHLVIVAPSEEIPDLISISRLSSL